MGKIYDFVLSVLTVCVISGVAVGLAPEGSIKKYIKFIVSLCVLAAILTPLIGVISSIPSVGEESSEIFGKKGEESGEYGEKQIEAQKAAIEAAICDIVSSKFGIDKGAVSVSITIDAQNISAIEIREIKINVKSKCNTAEIENYIGEMFYGTARVTVTEGSDG